MSSLTVGGMFAVAARRQPDRPAIVEDGTATSYRDLADAVGAAAQGLRADGALTRGDRVLVMASNSVALLTTVLACATAGMVVVPVSTQLTPRELAHIVGDCSPRLVLHSAEYEPAVRGALAKCSGTPAPAVHEITTFVTEHGLGSPAADDGRGRDVGPEDLIYLGYTSGTTGAPKGVKVTHRNRVQSVLLQAAEFGFGRDDTHLVVSPLYHTAPLTFALLHLCMGGSVVVTREFDAERIAGQLGSGTVTNTFLAPAALQRVLARLPEQGPHERLHAVIIGGAPCPAAVKTAALRRLPGRLWEFYGATEVGIVTTLRPDEQATHPRSAGRLIPGASVEVRDLETGEPLAAGGVGTVWIGTATTSDGYLGHAARATPDELIHIGDVGFVDDAGYLHLVDRSADIIISGGVNVYSREVEAVLETHPHVQDVAVFGVPDAAWGEAVVAAVVVSDSSLSPDDLVGYCRDSLAAFKRPKSVVLRADLPRSQTGKTDKRRLRAEYLDKSGSTSPAIA